MNKEFLALIVLVILTFGISSVVYVNAQPIDVVKSEHKLYVSYVDNTAESFELSVESGKKYTLTQPYSWVRDQTSRYNLVSYSIDDSKNIPISRQARGIFTLDIVMDSSHSVVFFAAAQHPIDVSGTTDVVFSPPSPTNDNWFDTNTEITISVPYTKEIEQNRQRVQLVGWSADGSELQTIQRLESGMFNSVITMSSLHKFDFRYVNQYYLDVVSQYGTISGRGWHDADTTVTVGVKSLDDFLVRHVLSGWQGEGIKPNGYLAIVLVDLPKTIVVEWTTDYSQLIMLVVIPVGIVAFVIIRNRYKQRLGVKSERMIHTAEVRQDLTGAIETRQNEDYAKEIEEYVLQKASEKLDSMRSLLDDNRYVQIKERLKEA